MKWSLLIFTSCLVWGASCTPATGYLHCGIITVNGYAGASTLTHYPLAISGTFAGSAGAPDLRTTGNGGWVQNTIGIGALLDGVYLSGGSITGTVGQTCTLTSFNQTSTATATVALTGTNVISARKAIVVTSAGSQTPPPYNPPTSATLGSGTATCSGTATLLTHTTPTAIPTDLILTTDSAGTTLVAGWEWESYTASSGLIVLWVDVASLSGTSTTLYASVGKSAVTTWQGNVGGTWNSNFSAVYHQNQDGIDSTSNYNNCGGTRAVHYTTGILANGSDGVNGGGCGQSAVSGVPTNFASGNAIRSIEAWYTNNSSSDTTCRAIIGYGDSNSGGSSDRTFNLYLQSSNTTMMIETDFSGGRGSCTPFAGGYFTTAPVNTGSTFHYALAALPSGGSITTDLVIYVDTVQKTLTYLNNGSTVINTNAAVDTSIDFSSNTAANSPYVTGVVDEARFMSTPPSTDWIAAVYKNINTPSSFFTFVGGGVTPPPFGIINQ